MEKQEFFEMDYETIEKIRKEQRANIKASVVTGDIIEAEVVTEHKEE